MMSDEQARVSPCPACDAGHGWGSCPPRRTLHAAPLLLCALALATLLGTPALAINLERPEVRAFIDEMANTHQLKRTAVRTLLQEARSVPSIIEAMTRPAEQVLPWYDYRERFLTERRIQRGVAFWNQQGHLLAQSYETTGVAPEVILGILGVETLFGEITGRFRVLDALVTLSFDYPPRASFFRSELAEFLLLTHNEKVDARLALGSYAGAMGAPQFMPSNYRKLAVDGDGDGRRDLWSSWPDVVASVANYLRFHGWRRDEPVLVSATLDTADLAKFDTSRISLNETVTTLREKGTRFETDLPPDTPALLIVVEGRDGPEIRVGFHNFVVISRYNPRVKYALAVHELGEAIARARTDARR